MLKLTTQPREGFTPTPLSDEDLEKLAFLKETNRFLYETEYYRRLGYFHVKMNNFFQSDKLTKGGFGGNRSAKTGCGGRAVSMYADDSMFYYEEGDLEKIYHAPIGSLRIVRRDIGKGKKIWIVSKTTGQQVEAAQRWVMHYFDDDLIEKVTWRNKGKNIRDGFTVKKTKTRIIFKSQDQGRENLQGAGLDLIWMDEEAPRQIFSELFMRQEGGVDLNFWLTMTPLNGKSWVFYDIFESEDEDVFVDTFSWADNPWLTEKQKIRMRSKYSKRELTAREFGLFDDPKDKVCGWFDEEVHEMDPVDMPISECSLYLAGDWGFSDPATLLFIGVDIKRNLYVYDAIKKAETNNATLINLTKTKLGGRHLTGGWADNSDPQAISEFQRAGLNIQPVNKKIHNISGSSFNVGSWFQAMANAMDYFGEVKEGTGEPKIFISSKITAYNTKSMRDENWLREQLNSLMWRKENDSIDAERIDKWDAHRNFGHHFDGVFALAYFCVMFRVIQDVYSANYTPVVRSRRGRRKYYTR